MGTWRGLNLGSCNPGARKGLECEPGEKVHAERGKIPVGRGISVLPYIHRGMEGLDKELAVLGSS